MRKHYDFSKGVRGSPYTHRLAQLRKLRADPDQEIPPLTPAQIRELRRRLRDADDRTRFILVKYLTPKAPFYYNVSYDTYAVNHPGHATIFKRRAAAIAVQGAVGRHLKVIRCRVNARDELVLSSLPKSSRGRSRKGAA